MGGRETSSLPSAVSTSCPSMFIFGSVYHGNPRISHALVRKKKKKEKSISMTCFHCLLNCALCVAHTDSISMILLKLTHLDMITIFDAMTQLPEGLVCYPAG